MKCIYLCIDYLFTISVISGILNVNFEICFLLAYDFAITFFIKISLQLVLTVKLFDEFTVQSTMSRKDSLSNI